MCWFRQPIVSGDRATVEWWGSWTEQGQKLTFAGVTVLRFDDRGKVVEHHDYNNHVERRQFAQDLDPSLAVAAPSPRPGTHSTSGPAWG